MAQYKVPQDVEADDKLLGPFSFRQFIYLLIAGACVALAIGLFQIFPLLAAIPLPIIFFFAILALPLKKDQPMETYLAALVSFYLKPRKRFWVPGQRESTITITAPKVVEKPRVRDISEEEASHRLSFLADIVDTEGESIKNTTSMRDDYAAEANNAPDIFDDVNTNNIDYMINQEQTAHKNEVLNQMRTAIQEVKDEKDLNPPQIKKHENHDEKPEAKPEEKPEEKIEDVLEPKSEPKPKKDVVVKPDLKSQKSTSTKAVKPSIIELANNPDYSIETIQKEANRINQKDEVYISLR